MTGNPLSDEKGDDFKREVLIALHEIIPSLNNINEEEVTPEDLEDAMTTKKERIL